MESQLVHTYLWNFEYCTSELIESELAEVSKMKYTQIFTQALEIKSCGLISLQKNVDVLF